MTDSYDGFAAHQRKVLGMLLYGDNTKEDITHALEIIQPDHMGPLSRAWSTARRMHADGKALTETELSVAADMPPGSLSDLEPVYDGTPLRDCVRILLEQHTNRQVRHEQERIARSAIADLQNGLETPETLNALLSEVQRQLEKHTAAQKPRDAWKTLGELGVDLRDTPPPREYLFYTKHKDGIVPAGKVGQFVGPGGVSKSYTGIGLALSVATGRPFGEWVTHRASHDPMPGRVLLAMGEESPKEVHERMHYAARAMGLDNGALELVQKNVIALGLAGQHVSLTYGLNELSAARRTGPIVQGSYQTPYFYDMLGRLNSSPRPWRLIIIDPLSRFAAPDSETDNAAGTRFIQTLEQLTKVIGNPTVIATHHTNQASRKPGEITDGTAARGASSLHDGARFQFNIETVVSEEKVPLPFMRIRHTKHNYSARADNVLFARDARYYGALRPCTRDELREIRKE